MKKTPVTVNFDIGKTNKKVLAFDEDFRVVYNDNIRFGEITDEDGFPCENLQALENFMFDSLHAVSVRGLDIRAVNFSAYGSGLVYIGDDGKPLTPLYNYLKPYPAELKKQFFEAHGTESLLNKKSAAKIEGSLNAGLQIYRLKYAKRILFEATKYALHLPQYLSYLFSEKAFSEITSIGCHTGLWDFEKNNYHDWVISEGIAEKLPPIVPATTVTPVSFDDKELLVGVGLHDSSASLIPYQNKTKEPFILISTGTWCVSMNPFANADLTEKELNNDCLCYLSTEGRPVKASRRMLGKKFEDGTTIDEIINEQIDSTRMVMHGTYPGKIFVDGGFSKNASYMKGISDGFKGIDVQAAELSHASALGAAMLMKKALL
jgi:sugar (pentulose or hexulose) kinase